MISPTGVVNFDPELSEWYCYEPVPGLPTIPEDDDDD